MLSRIIWFLKLAKIRIGNKDLILFRFVAEPEKRVDETQNKAMLSQIGLELGLNWAWQNFINPNIKMETCSENFLYN